MFLINILLFLFLFILISGIITVVRIAWRIRQMHRQMKEQFGQGTASARNRQTHTSSRQTANGETITDTRDPQKANRKVIADDEGEYIDFARKIAQEFSLRRDKLLSYFEMLCQGVATPQLCT